MTYSTDTRSIQPGEIYVAIRGEVHDGHRFIPQAIEKGASGIVTEQDVEAPEGVEVIRVESSEDYLVATASEKLRQSGARVVAITGSIGKTTTRAALHAVLAQSFPVVPSEGNRNTPLGLSLLVLNREITADSVLVLEMGARLKGDIKTLCEHFPPDISVVTNVRGVHVETFGSIDGVQREKSELVRALGPEAVAVLNADDPRTRAMADLHEGTTLLYGRAEDAELRPDAVRVDLPILGDHAAAVGQVDLGLRRGLGRLRGLRVLRRLGRRQRGDGGVRLRGDQRDRQRDESADRVEPPGGIEVAPMALDVIPPVPAHIGAMRGCICHGHRSDPKEEKAAAARKPRRSKNA